jgi:hypothetical protein
MYIADDMLLMSFFPCSVEKPFLKPVVLAGPNTGERRKLLEMLVAEFPDVFAWPRMHTTLPPNEQARHMGADGDELQLVTDKPGCTPRLGAKGQHGFGDAAEGSEALRDTAASAADAATAAAESGGAAGSASCQKGAADGGCTGSSSSNGDRSSVLEPEPVVMGREEFEAAAAAGGFLEAHADLVKHKLATHRHAYSMEHVREVIKSGEDRATVCFTCGCTVLQPNLNISKPAASCAAHSPQLKLLAFMTASSTA